MHDNVTIKSEMLLEVLLIIIVLIVLGFHSQSILEAAIN